MIRVLKCMIAFVIYIIVFDIFGTFVTNRLKWKLTQVERLLWGFFVYYTLFQCVYLPFVFLKQKFTLLVRVWIIVLVVCVVTAAFISIRKNDTFVSVSREMFRLKIAWIYYVILVLLGLEAVFIMLQSFLGWDTAYYIGVMNETLYTDRMYFYNGNTGLLEEKLPIRYAMSGFYMQFAICSKLMAVEPVVLSYYLVRIMCFFLSAIIVYLIGKEIFKQDNRKAMIMTLVWGFVNLFWYSTHATTFFLIKRSYEAKGYCANVILPMVFYCLLRIMRDGEKEKQNWQMLFLLALSSVAISMSSLVTVPAMVGTGMFTVFILKKDKYILRNGIMCLIPNILYLVAYLLSVLNVFVIEV